MSKLINALIQFNDLSQEEKDLFIKVLNINTKSQEIYKKPPVDFEEIIKKLNNNKNPLANPYISDKQIPAMFPNSPMLDIIFGSKR